MTIGEKINILLENNEMNQKQLAEMLHVAPTTVQKWVVGKNAPTLETYRDLSELFYVPLQDLIDESAELFPYIEIDCYLPYSRAHIPDDKQDTEHIIIDAGLACGAKLHRFTNAGGEKCSAIYIGNREEWWHYRDHEAHMIRCWNENHA